MRVEIRSADAADVPGLRHLDGLSPVSGRLLTRDIGADDRSCLVGCTDDGEVVAYVAAAVHLDEAHVLDVVVSPAWRRRGIATALLTELDRRLAELGVAGTTLEVRESSDGAQALYRHLGFVVEGRRPGYYPDGEAALIMWKRDERRSRKKEG